MLLGLSLPGVDPFSAPPLWWESGATVALSGTLGDAAGTLSGWQRVFAALGGVLADVSGGLVEVQEVSTTVQVGLYSADGTPLAGVVVRAVPLRPFGIAGWMVPLTPVEATTDANGLAVLGLFNSNGADFTYRLTVDVGDVRLFDRELRPDDTLRGQRWH